MGQVDVVLSLQKRRADRIPCGIHQQFGARVTRELQCDAMRRGSGYGRRLDIKWCGGVALRISVGFRSEILFFAKRSVLGSFFGVFKPHGCLVFTRKIVEIKLKLNLFPSKNRDFDHLLIGKTKRNYLEPTSELHKWARCASRPLNTCRIPGIR